MSKIFYLILLRKSCKLLREGQNMVIASGKQNFRNIQQGPAFSSLFKHYSPLLRNKNAHSKSFHRSVEEKIFGIQSRKYETHHRIAAKFTALPPLMTFQVG
jgi:hypothetical protein